MGQADFKIEESGGPSAATQEFSGAGEEKKDEVQTEAAGGGEEIGGGGGGEGVGGQNDDDPGNQDDDVPDGTTGDEASVNLSDRTLVEHDAETASDVEEQKAVKEIDPEELARALEEALDCQCPLEVNASLLEFVAGDIVELRHNANVITVDVIGIDPDSDECVGLNQSDSDWMTNTAHIPYGCYVKFKKQNVVNVV